MFGRRRSAVWHLPLEPNEVRGLPEIAARICRLRADGMSYGAIAATLNDEQGPTAQGGATRHPPTVRKIARRSTPRVAA